MPASSHDMLSAKQNLIGFIGRYLAALVTHDPSSLPLADNVRFTENTKELPLGEGLWKTASEIKYRHCVADPVSGQVGLFSTLHEGDDRLTFLAARLKVEDEKITEIETLVSRYAGSDVAFKPKSLNTPHPLLTESVPEPERLPRDKMIAIADSYFEGLEKNTGEFVPLHDSCNRLENGLQTTNNPELGAFGSFKCRDQLPIFTYMTCVRDRRYVIADEELGIVWSMVMFDIPGNVKTADMPGYGVIELPARTQYPRSMLLAELFKIRGGLIHHIEAILTSVPLGTPAGWP
ncbi:MAG: hypothetical protein JW943_10725 [Deltaproteobacteria bacterium]|nr:hypothetical protein [Deltaproteobacteria bacterium]